MRGERRERTRRSEDGRVKGFDGGEAAGGRCLRWSGLQLGREVVDVKTGDALACPSRVAVRSTERT